MFINYKCFHIRSLAVSCRGGSPRASSRLEAVAGLSTEPVPVSAYVGSSKNLKDLKGKTVDSGEMCWLAVHVG